jgi:hypothetical protein
MESGPAAVLVLVGVVGGVVVVALLVGVTVIEIPRDLGGCR